MAGTAWFARPGVFWVGATACVVGVGLHLPMYFGAADVHYRLAGMTPDPPMITGMVLIGVGLVLSLWGLVPRGAGEVRREVARIRVRALDDAPIRWRHVALLVVLALAVTIDVMKPTTLSFVVPGVAREYGLRSAANPHGHVPVTWLPLAGITGTVLGSLLWGWVGDRIGRRASVLYAGILFVSTSVCGAMPGFGWNLVMCFVMGIGAGGMLPIAFALLVETIPARHRGWLVVLVGGDIAGAYVLTSWLAGALTPAFGWRILWLVGLPTGALLIVLNRWIPESPRFLLATGRRAAAEAVLARFGAAVVAEPALVTGAGVAGVAEPALVTRMGPAVVAEPGPESAVRTGDGSVGGFAALWRRPFTGATAAVAGIAVAGGLLTFGFQFWVPSNLQHLGLSEVSSDYVLRDSALLGLPLTVVVAILYGVWSSRGTVLALSGFTALAVGAFAVLGDGAVRDRGWLAVLLVVPLSGISSLAAVITAYGAEIYPTRVRSRGVGLVAGMTKAGGVAVLAVVLAGMAAPSLAVTAALGAVPLLAAALLFARTAPDTHRRRLEDITPAERVPAR